ncbi:unnamed protein product [Sphagnum balticum]
MLVSRHGECSGVEIEAPSGKIYTMTARHCMSLTEEGHIISLKEGFEANGLMILGIDRNSDLMILESSSKYGIRIGKEDAHHIKIHTLTHGDGKPTYRTDGELLGDEIIVSGSKGCRSNNCVSILLDTVSTAAVLPGSSGGAVLDENGDLVGIVSALDTRAGFSYMVPLSSIQAFMADK